MADLLNDGKYKSVITSGSHGENYQKEVALTLCLRMRGCSSRCRLAYKVEEADKFDDVVLIDDGEKEIHFIQVKHTDAKDDEVKYIELDALFPTTGKENSKGNFDLCKYIKSFLIVNHRFEQGDSEEKFARKYYVLTNKQFIYDLQMLETNESKFKEWVKKVEERKVHEILQLPKSIAKTVRHLKLTPTENAIKELGKQINKDFLAVEKAMEAVFKIGTVGSILKSYSTPLKNVLKINENMSCSFREGFSSENKQFSVASLYNKLKDKLDLKKPVIVEENFLQKNSFSKFLPPYISEDEIKDFFCNSFTLLVGHPNCLQPVIDSELRRWMKSCIRPDILGKLSKNELDQVLTDLKKKIDKLNEPNENKIKCALKKSDVEQCLEEIRIASKIFECEEVEELQGNYINRTIVYTAAEGLKDRLITKTTDSLSCANFNFRTTIDRVISDTDFVGELRGTFKDHQHIVLVADPGMGKTSLLQFLAFEVQKQNDVVDVYLVYLSSLVKELDKIERISDLDGVIRVLRAVLSKENCEIIKYTPGQRDVKGFYPIVILFDGFDEIHSKYTDRVIEMLDQLTSKKIQIVISSRMHVKQLLEKNMKLRSMILQPFSEKDQIRYLKKMWKVVDEADPCFVNYSKQLLDKFHSSIPSNLREITGLPLMMRMLAEIYYDRFKAATTDNVQQVDFTKDEFNIVQLYRQFIKKCFHMKLKEKYQHIGDINDVELDSVIEGYILEHQLLAMRLLNVKILNDTSKNPHFKEKCDEFISRCERKSEKSLLVKVVDNNVQFCHLTYGEYFVAKYLCDHIFSIGAELVISIWYEHEAIRRLSMIKLEGNEAFYEVVNTLCESSWEIALWACESGCLKMVSYLVRYFKSISPHNLNMMLQESAKIGFFEICKFLLKNNSDPNGVNQNRWTALHWAASKGHVAVVGLLLQNQAKVDAQEEDKWTALHLAAQNGHATVVDLLLQKQANVDAQENTKWTALHLAALKGHVTVVGLLLHNQAKVDAQTNKNWTALQSAARNGHAAVVGLLLQNQAKVDAQLTDRRTALHLAAQNGHTTVVGLLLQNQANVDAQTNKKWTALHCAAQKGHATVVGLLLQNQAKVDAQEEDKWTALHLAAQNGHATVVDLLLQNQAKVEAQANKEWTALHFAAQKGHATVVGLLLQNQAKVDAQANNERTALHLAAEKGDAAVVALLLQNQAKVDAQTNKKWTPLHFAALFGHDNVAKLLIDNNANTNLRTNKGETPLDTATRKRHQHIAELLQQPPEKSCIQ